MKRLFIPLIAGLLLSCTQSPAQNNNQDTREKERQEKQEAKEREKEVERAEKNREREASRRKRYLEKYPEQFKEHISKQFTLQKPATGSVVIYNLEGSVRVEGYAGDKVLIEVDKTISAKDKETLEQGKKEIKVEFEQIGDSVVAYMKEPWDMRPHDWRDRNDWNDRRRIEYNCALQFVVKVPSGVNLVVSTVNDGEILVKDVTGKLKVTNVNGGIEIVNARGTTNATTINGDLTVNYTANPTEASSFYTLNGRLTATFQPNLSADLTFKSMNGAFYTDFDSQILAPSVIKNEEKKGGGTVYKLQKDTQVRIGSGGKLFKFETMNGNIYIKKQS